MTLPSDSRIERRTSESRSCRRWSCASCACVCDQDDPDSSSPLLWASIAVEGRFEPTDE